MNKLNDYTKPKLVSNVVDIYNEDTKKFEYWNDLQSDYLNISQPVKGIPKLGAKEWSFIGCGLDFNNIDSIIKVRFWNESVLKIISPRNFDKRICL